MDARLAHKMVYLDSFSVLQYFTPIFSLSLSFFFYINQSILLNGSYPLAHDVNTVRQQTKILQEIKMTVGS